MARAFVVPSIVGDANILIGAQRLEYIIRNRSRIVESL